MISRFFFHVKFSFFHTVWNITLEFRPLLASFSPTTVNMWSQFSHLTNRFALIYWLMSTRIGCPHFGQVLWLSETRKKLREINHMNQNGLNFELSTVTQIQRFLFKNQIWINNSQVVIYTVLKSKNVSVHPNLREINFKDSF